MAEISSESPNNIDGQHFQKNFMFDLNPTDMTDLASDFNEFNDFFKNKSSQLKEIERPQNPFHKNFQSYQNQHQHTDKKLAFSSPLQFDHSQANSVNQRNSFSSFDMIKCSNDSVSEPISMIQGMKKQ